MWVRLALLLAFLLFSVDDDDDQAAYIETDGISFTKPWKVATIIVTILSLVMVPIHAFLLFFMFVSSNPTTTATHRFSSCGPPRFLFSKRWPLQAMTLTTTTTTRSYSFFVVFASTTMPALFCMLDRLG
jgi:hypothetical protein